MTAWTSRPWAGFDLKRSMEMVSQTEVELKLWVAPGDIAALRNHPHFAGALHHHSRQMLDSIYFDSDDRFLRDHGFNLRVRHIGGKSVQTIKSIDHGVGLFERSEWEQTIAGDEPDLAQVSETALGRLLADEGGRELKPVFETRFERSAYHLDRSGADVVMAIDEGEILATGSSRPISEIELELKQGCPADLFKIAREILDIVPADLGFKSKSERGYELAAKSADAVEMASDPELNADMSAGRAFTLVGRACLHHLAANAPLIIGRDGTALHQTRVALRRLRAAISLFAAVVADDRTEAIKTELKWLARELSPARDLDTLLSEVIGPVRARNRHEPGLVSISKSFTRKRLKSYRQAQEAVRSARFRMMVLDSAEWVEAGPWSSSADVLMRARREMPVELFASEQLSRRYKKIRRRGAKINDLDTAQLHGLRIQVKKARYATEFFSGLYRGRKSAKQLRYVKSSLMQLQAYLGRLNDIATHKALFLDVIDHPAKAGTEEQSRRRAFAAGLIIGDQQAQIEGLLERARKAHSRFERAKKFWKLPNRNSATAAPVAAAETQP